MWKNRKTGLSLILCFIIGFGMTLVEGYINKKPTDKDIDKVAILYQNFGKQCNQ